MAYQYPSDLDSDSVSRLKKLSAQINLLVQLYGPDPPIHGQAEIGRLLCEARDIFKAYEEKCCHEN